jgi:flagellin
LFRNADFIIKGGRAAALPKTAVSGKHQNGKNTMSNSILTNVGAQAALQNLRSVGNNLGQVQERISTGLKVGNAKDNASAFAVAQTMRSDIASFQAIGEGLSVSESTVSVARQAAETVSDLVKTLQQKITDAENPAVQNEKIQSDIDQTIDQIKTVIGAAQFNGVNLVDGEGVQRILSSVNRAGENVSAGYIDVSRADLRVEGGLGMLNDLRVSDVRGAELLQKAPTTSSTDHQVEVSLNGLDGGNAGNVTIDINGEEITQAVAAGESAGTVLQNLAATINADDDVNDDVTASVQDGKLVLSADEEGADGRFTAANLTTPATFTGGSSVKTTQIGMDQGETAARISIGEQPEVGSVLRFAVDGQDYKITFTEDGGDNSTFNDNVFEASVSLGADADALRTNLLAALESVEVGGEDAFNIQGGATAAAGLLDLPSGDQNGGVLTLSAVEGVSLSGVNFRSGVGEDYQTLLSKVESALQTATGAAAEFGSIGQRLEMQSEFVDKLTGALEAGVGALVDADMAEESARLQALQVQQQLSTQALSIANSQPQNLLALFG